MDIRFLGHACFELTDGDTRVLVDPFLTGNPNAAAEASELEPTHIFLTHGHADHYGDIVDIAQAHRRTWWRSRSWRASSASRGSRTWRTPISVAPSSSTGGWVRITPAWHTSTSPNGTVNTPGRARDQPRRQDRLPRRRHRAVLRHPAGRRARRPRRGVRLHRRPLHDGPLRRRGGLRMDRRAGR